MTIANGPRNWKQVLGGDSARVSGGANQSGASTHAPTTQGGQRLLFSTLQHGPLASDDEEPDATAIDRHGSPAHSSTNPTKNTPPHKHESSAAAPARLHVREGREQGQRQHEAAAGRQGRQPVPDGAQRRERAARTDHHDGGVPRILRGGRAPVRRLDGRGRADAGRARGTELVGAWLKSKDLLRMRKGDIPNEVEICYMNEELEDPTDRISTKFPIEIPDGSIHVLVVVSPDVGSKRPADDEVDDVQKRLRLMESDLAAIKPDLAAMKPKTLTEFTPLSVHEDEFRLDSLSMTRQRDDPVVMTPTLHEFWKGFGEFPHGEGACHTSLETKETYERGGVFDGRWSYARLSDLSSQDIKAIRGQAQGATVLVDGFNQAEVEDPDKNYMPFDVLATSCQFDAKQDDNSRIVVLPAWRDADLLQYAKLTNWVVDSGLRKIKRQNTPMAKLVREQYFYSGGSLREFCKERGLLVEHVAKYCLPVDNQQAFELVYNYGGGQSKSQVDRLRRHYITDCSLEVDYRDSRNLSTLRKDTYSYPDYPFFPFIDAVTTCEAFPSKSEADGKGQHLSNKSETIVAYIQVTIRSEKKFKEERLRRMNEEMDKNSSLKDMKRAFVVVGPDFGVCEMFDLRDAPDPNTFLTMVSCFSPEQLEPEVR
ncbi:unnamed protein product [Phytophthora lilii]|uniref:Unnamed protein product n=1 Tax=Phytophthora lilii TaxID=2077276 RepID=A0A9W6TA38_9STRA|nr:unnamed protein product [Phytophthora lilii]